VAVPLVFELIFVGALTNALVGADQAIRLARHSEQILTQLNTITNSFDRQVSISTLFFLTRSDKKYDQYRSLRKIQDAELSTLRQLIGEDPQQLDNFDRLKGKLFDVFDRMDRMVDTVHGHSDWTALGTLHVPSLIREVSQRTEDVLSAISVITTLEHERNQRYSSGEKAARQLVSVWLVAAVAGNMVVCLALAIFFGRDITTRLGTIVDNTFRLRSKTELRKPLRGDDEIAYLDRVFHEMSDEIRATELKRLQLDNLKRDFANMVSHDLRSPLMAIRCYLENLSDGIYGNIDEKGKTTAEHMLSSLGRLLTLVSGLLELERMEDPTTKLELQPEPVRELLQDVTEQLRLLAEGKQVGLAVAEVPNGVCVLAERDRFSQLLQNLVSNAIAYSPPGTTVDVTCRRQGDQIEFRVRDEGPGIPKEQQQDIFDRFKQLDSASKSQAESKGFGLGLAICKAIVEQHHGTIGVESQSGKGSTFWFRIPSTARIDTSGTPASVELNSE